MKTLQQLYRLRLAESIAAGDTTPMMIFPIGEWHSSKYPDLPLSEDLANELIANFEANILGTEPVVDSSGKHDTSAPAAGWVKRVYLASYEEGDVTGLALWADVKWTALGATMLTDEQYKYGSVEIGPVTLNDSGETVDNVLRSLTLTNTPVLRIMPGVKNAAEKQRAVVTLSLSEYTLGEPGSTNDLRDAIQEAVSARFGALMGEGGYITDFGPDWVIWSTWQGGDDRHWRTDYQQTEQGITLGDPVEVKRETTYVPVSDGAPGAASPSGSPAVAMGEAGEGTGVAASEVPAAQKGADKQMKTIIQHLKLAEGASESDVLAAVVKLAEERDTEKTRADAAEIKLAERDKADKARDFDAKLSEALAEKDGAVHMLPGEKDTYLKLAEIDHDAAMAAVQARIDGPAALKLGPVGVGSEGDADEDKPANVQLAEKAKIRAAKDGITLDAAQKLTLAEDPDLAKRIHTERYGKEA